MNYATKINDRWKVTGCGKNGEIIGPIDATVPGHVHTDLLREGIMKDPMWRDNAADIQWVEHFDWVYETEFECPEEVDREWAQLVFEGLDTICTVYVNGMMVGKADNMFIPYTFNIGEYVKAGANRLEVRFASIQEYLKDKDIGRYSSCFSQDRVFIRRMQCTFGWDWVCRLISYGIWRPVYLVSRPDGYIDDIWVRTIDLKDNVAILSWGMDIRIKQEQCELTIQLFNDTGEIVLQHVIRNPAEMIHGEFEVPDPRLWWPNGYGPQAMYLLKTALTSSQGELIDEKNINFGIRTVQVEQIPDEQGSSFTIVINGQRIFAKGGNWVPADPFPSRPDREKYSNLMQLLKDGNMNMLRVWGGGTYERPEFWDTCDRMGIMVSLDFMMACAHYPENEKWFIDAMKEEANIVIRELRNHPSLIFWYGNNELAMNSNSEDEYPGKMTSLLVTEPLCSELDPNRPYFPTSPYKGRPFNSQDEGDCHYSTWYDPHYIMGDMSNYRRKISEGCGRFVSEYAVPGSPPINSLLKMMTFDDISDEKAEIWEFRTNDNPYKGCDDITHYQMLEMTALKLFGSSRDVVSKVKKMEYVQYEFARLEAEHYRRRKYKSSGLLFWMYNDCWPASGWAMVDYFGYPKAGYYGAKKSFKPVMVSIEDRGDEVGVWLVNDTLKNHRGEISIKSASTSGRYLFSDIQEVSITPNTVQLVKIYNKAQIGLACSNSDVVMQACWLSKESGNTAVDEQYDSTCFFDVLPKNLVLQPAKLLISWEYYDETSGLITVKTDNYARVVTIENELILDDNYFDLMPDETRKVRYRTKKGTKLDRMSQVTCWNGC